MGVIHLARTHEGGGGRAKAYTMRTKGDGVDKFKYVRKKAPFCMHFDTFSYAMYFCYTLLSLVMNFITVLENICYDYFPVSQVFLIFFCMKLLIGYLKTFSLELAGGSER